MKRELSLDGLWNADLFGIAQLNLEMGFLEANAKWLALYGVKEEAELVQLSIKDILVHSDQEATSAGMIRQVASGQRKGYSFERECRRRDGSQFWARIFVGPRFDDGHLTGITSVVMDITSEKANPGSE